MHTHRHSHRHILSCISMSLLLRCLHSISFQLSSDYVHKATQFAWKLIVLCLITQHAITRPLIRLGTQLLKALLCVLFIYQTRPFIAFYFSSQHHSNHSLIQRTWWLIKGSGDETGQSGFISGCCRRNIWGRAVWEMMVCRVHKPPTVFFVKLSTVSRTIQF